MWHISLGYQFLCHLPALAEGTNRDHYPSSCVIIVTKKFLSHFPREPPSSFLIFGTEHRYGELYRVTHFWICSMSTSCLTRLEYCGHRQICSHWQDNFCHIFLGNHTGQLPDIWHRASVYGELYRVTHFWICSMSTSCLTWLWILWT